MLLPELNIIDVGAQGVDVFGGIDRNLRISDGMFSDMENLTSEYYPVLSPRQPRGIFAHPDSCGGIISKNKLCYADGAYFVIGDERIDLGLTSGEKQLISMGAYVIILPDKKYISTADTSDHGDIEANFTASEAVFTVCREDGTVYDKIIAVRNLDITEGYSHEDFLWYDPTVEPGVYRRYYQASAMWVEVPVYVRIECVGIGAVFSVGDGVNLSGITDEALSQLCGDLVVTACGDDYIVVSGSFAPSSIDDELNGASIGSIKRTVSCELSITRSMPVMDHVACRGNRLFGCRYGLSADGEFVNEIYVSKADDFKNWHCFAGIASDSYAATVGSDGPFTGAVSFGRTVLFFKERCIHILSGDFPEEFSLHEVICDGIAEGSHGSAAVVGGALYYLSSNGVMAYDGSMPVCVSSCFGVERYHSGIGAAYGRRYYLSALDGDGMAHLLVYDTRLSLWHREDALRVLSFAEHGGVLHMLSDDGVIYTSCGDHEKAVHWYAVTGRLGLSSCERKYISRLSVRLSASPGSVVHFFVEYDSSGDFIPAATLQGVGLRSVTVPIRLRRCDHLRLRIEGVGEAKIYSVVRFIEECGI